MRKFLGIGLAAGLVAAVFVAPAIGRTVPIVTGGATNLVPGLNVTVNGLFDENSGEFKGKINYDYSVTGEHYLFRIECVSVDESTNTAVAVGPEKNNPDMWGIAWIQDKGEGAMDDATVAFRDEATALSNCANPQDLAAVPVTDGNFVVRPFTAP